MQNPPAHELHMTTLITPAMANFSGNLHGGELLKMLDQVAYACASRYSGNMCVTLSVDNVIFKEPIHVGELVNYYANSCYFTMVAMKDGKPVAVPPLALQTEQQIQRHAAAQQRKKMRLQANS